MKILKNTESYTSLVMTNHKGFAFGTIHVVVHEKLRILSKIRNFCTEHTEKYRHCLYTSVKYANLTESI